MKRTVLLSIIVIIVGCVLYGFLKPGKDYRELAIGRWKETQNNVYADVTYNEIRFSQGRNRYKLYYDLHVDRDPMEIEIWEHKDKRKTYRGYVDFENDNKVKARKKPEDGDKGDYYAEMAGKFTTIWERVRD